jgi:hypothetical protein
MFDVHGCYPNVVVNGPFGAALADTAPLPELRLLMKPRHAKSVGLRTSKARRSTTATDFLGSFAAVATLEANADDSACYLTADVRACFETTTDLAANLAASPVTLPEVVADIRNEIDTDEESFLTRPLILGALAELVPSDQKSFA